MKKFMLLSIIALLGCGEECFDGIKIHPPIDINDKEIINNLISVFPETLHTSPYCTEIYVLYSREDYLNATSEYENNHATDGLCSIHNDHKIVYVQRLERDSTFAWMLTHELCHAVGYRGHGEEFYAARNAVFDEYAQRFDIYN